MESSDSEQSQHPLVKITKASHKIAEIKGWATCLALKSETEGLIGNYGDQLYAFRLKDGGEGVENRLVTRGPTRRRRLNLLILITF